MAIDVLILNTAVMDLRSPDFAFVDRLVGKEGLAKCATSDMPKYTQVQLKAYIDQGCATAGGPGNTAPLLASAGLRVAVGTNLGKGAYEGLDVQGRAFHDILAKNSVNMSATIVHPTLPTGITFIHETQNNERGGIAYFPNANNDFAFDLFKQHVQRLAPSIVYYMYSGLSDRGDSNDGKDLADFVAWCRAQDHITIVDSHTLTGNPQKVIARGQPVPAYRLLRPLLKELDIFFTSADEARMIRNTLDFGKADAGADDRDSSLSFLEYVTAQFSGKGRRRTQLFGVTVKNGAYAKFVGPDDRVHETVFYPSRFMAGSVIDLVGAGDSFRAGLIAFIARHRDAFLNGTLNIEDAVQTGNLMASLYIKSPLNDRYGNIVSLDALMAVVCSKREFTSFEELIALLKTGA